MERRRITTNVSHVPKEGPNHLHVDVGPGTLIEGTLVLNRGNCVVNRSEGLSVQYLLRHDGEIYRYLQNFLDVISAGNPLLSECPLHSNAVECQDIDHVRKARRQPDELEDIPNLGGRQPVDVVKHHGQRLIQSGKSSSDLAWRLITLSLRRWSNFARILTAALPLSIHAPRGNQPNPENVSPYSSRILADLYERRTEFELCREFNEECIDKLLGTTEHPRIEVENDNAGLLYVCTGKINERGLPRAPGPENAYDHPFCSVKGEDMLSKGAGDPGTTEDILIRLPNRVVGTDLYKMRDRATTAV